MLTDENRQGGFVPSGSTGPANLQGHSLPRVLFSGSLCTGVRVARTFCERILSEKVDSCSEEGSMWKGFMNVAKSPSPVRSLVEELGQPQLGLSWTPRVDRASQGDRTVVLGQEISCGLYHIWEVPFIWLGFLSPVEPGFWAFPF